MTGKELADTLFAAFDEGNAPDDPGLVDEMVGALASLSTDEMWRFMFEAVTKARAVAEGYDKFVKFNAACVTRDAFEAAVKRAREAPRPPELPR